MAIAFVLLAISAGLVILGMRSMSSRSGEPDSPDYSSTDESVPGSAASGGALVAVAAREELQGTPLSPTREASAISPVNEVPGVSHVIPPPADKPAMVDAPTRTDTAETRAIPSVPAAAEATPEVASAGQPPAANPPKTALGETHITTPVTTDPPATSVVVLEREREILDRLTSLVEASRIRYGRSVSSAKLDIVGRDDLTTSAIGEIVPRPGNASAEAAMTSPSSGEGPPNPAFRAWTLGETVGAWIPLQSSMPGSPPATNPLVMFLMIARNRNITPLAVEPFRSDIVSAPPPTFVTPIQTTNSSALQPVPLMSEPIRGALTALAHEIRVSLSAVDPVPAVTSQRILDRVRSWAEMLPRDIKERDQPERRRKDKTKSQVKSRPAQASPPPPSQASPLSEILTPKLTNSDGVDFGRQLD